MTSSIRHLGIVTSACFFALCAVPGAAAAQQCYYEIGIWSGSAYTYSTEVDLTLDAWGEAIDYSYCGGMCYHQYAVDFSVVRNESQTLYAWSGTEGVSQAVSVNTTSGTVRSEVCPCRLVFLCGRLV